MMAAFNEKIEDVSAASGDFLPGAGQHTLFVESKDVNNNWGVPGAVFLTVGTVHGVGLSPETAAQSTGPGQTVVYPLIVDNLGNTTDTFTVTLTSHWMTTAPVEIADLAGCGQRSLTVTVEVPADAVIGMSDIATVVVTSHADPAQAMSAVLTTDIIGAPPDVEPLACPSWRSGQAVVYSLSVTNTNE